MAKYGIIVEIDRCVGCHACAVACKEENKVAPGIFYERIHRVENEKDMVINWFRVSCILRETGLYADLPDEGDSPRSRGRSARRS